MPWKTCGSVVEEAVRPVEEWPAACGFAVDNPADDPASGVDELWECRDGLWESCGRERWLNEPAG
jgi:hypothetical protein